MGTENVKTAPVEEALWDARDVAAYLKTSRSWVYQRAEAGLLPSLRVGGLRRFEPAVIRAWARGETSAQAQATGAKVVHLTPRSEG